MNPTADWYMVGLASDLPNLDNDGQRVAANCKAFNIPQNGQMEPVEDIDFPGELRNQVLVFKYKDKYHAIDHQCPHSAYPLSRGSLFDIEDFGIVLSAGITCPKHEWSFDIFSGKADRGTYSLRVWEVEVRPSTTSFDADQEVWVRRKQRIG